MVKLTIANLKRGSNILEGMSLEHLEDIIEDNPKLRGILQGYIAEYKLIDKLRLLPKVTYANKIPDSYGLKQDILVIYEGIEITVECKSILSSSVGFDTMLNTWYGTVQCKNSDSIRYDEDDRNLRTYNLIRGGFDILSISTYALDNKWDSVYIENRYMPGVSADNFNLLKTNFVVNPLITPCIEVNLENILESVKDYKLK